MNRMDLLPDEVILHILSYLDIRELINLQLVSTRYLSLARDDALWKLECFNHSRAEALRLRLARLNLQDPSLAALRDALTALPGEREQRTNSSRPSQERTSLNPNVQARVHRNRALANWEPGYPEERLDYYEEFIQRHADIHIASLNFQSTGDEPKHILKEATGLGILSGATSQHVVAPFDDGRICIWDISAGSTLDRGGGGRILAQSQPGLLSGRPPSAAGESHAIMTETGAVECVAIDSAAQKGYFAVQSLLHEVDLNTLQISSTKQYPWPILALSEAREMTPVTVGTNLTVHLHDPRDPAFASSEASSSGELIGGSLYSHAVLEQPGPLSIVNHSGSGADGNSIWVAGRFTSLLNYDRRFFPRLRGTIFSGARIASLASIPHPFIPRSRDLLHSPQTSVTAFQTARSGSGTTLLAAAEYKGKGSLELYGLPGHESYQNRQTASATKLLSVAPHGGRIVFSDGDGNIQWVERDGFTRVRTFNVANVFTEPSDSHASELFSSAGADGPGQGEIVQKILSTSPTMSDTSQPGRPDIAQSNLVLWTGEGRLAVLGFGRGPLSGAGENWHDALEEQAQSIEERARQDAERQYGMAMRRALERNANEVRFVRGLGMGWGS